MRFVSLSRFHVQKRIYGIMDNIDHLRREIAKREVELAELKSQLALAESETRRAEQEAAWKWPLSQHEYDRYSRQMIVPKFGIQSVFTLTRVLLRSVRN